MANNNPNLYVPSGDLSSSRVIRDLIDRVNFLTTELDRVKMVIPGPGARKERPQPGIITIPSVPGNGFIRVNEDGVISSYTNPVDDIFPYVDTTTVGNVGAGVDPLHVFSVPAGTLIDGDYLSIHQSGKYALNDNNKRVLTLVGGATVEDGLGAPQDIDGTGAAVGWVSNTKAVRLSSTLMTVTATFVGEFLGYDGAGGVIIIGSYHSYNRNFSGLTVTNMDTLPLVIQASGEAVANNDVTQNLTIIERYRPKVVKFV